MDQLAGDLLQAVTQHRAVDLFQNVAPDLDDTVRPYAKNVRVERGMVELAEGESVRNDRLAARVPIGEDVRGFEKLAVTQPADRTRLTIRAPLAPDYLPHAYAQRITRRSTDIAAAIRQPDRRRSQPRYRSREV